MEKKKKTVAAAFLPLLRSSNFFFSHRTAGECREKKNTNGDMKRRSMIHLPTRAHKISFENMNRKRCAPSLWLRFRIMMVGSTIRDLLKQFLVLDAYSCCYPRDCICLKVRTSQKKNRGSQASQLKKTLFACWDAFLGVFLEAKCIWSVCKLYPRL